VFFGFPWFFKFYPLKEKLDGKNKLKWRTNRNILKYSLDIDNGRVIWEIRW